MYRKISFTTKTSCPTAAAKLQDTNDDVSFYTSIDDPAEVARSALSAALRELTGSSVHIPASHQIEMESPGSSTMFTTKICLDAFGGAEIEISAVTYEDTEKNSGAPVLRALDGGRRSSAPLGVAPIAAGFEDAETEIGPLVAAA